MSHTKRTPEFRLECEVLADKLRHQVLNADQIDRITQILLFNTSDSGCLVKAAENEPIFVLRGKDPIAAETVEAWIASAEARGIHSEKCADAQECADEMVAFSEAAGSRIL
jgi:hypothetical protein